MKKIKNYIVEYLHKHAGEEEKIESFALFVEDFFKGIHEEHSEIVDEFEDELEDLTDEIDEETMVVLVNHLKKRDGTHIGMKWSKDEVAMLAVQHQVPEKFKMHGKTYDACKFWFAMNYVYATHNSTNRLNTGYVDLALDEIFNKNVCFDHVLKQMYKKAV